MLMYVSPSLPLAGKVRVLFVDSCDAIALLLLLLDPQTLLVALARAGGSASDDVFLLRKLLFGHLRSSLCTVVLTLVTDSHKQASGGTGVRLNIAASFGGTLRTQMTQPHLPRRLSRAAACQHEDRIQCVSDSLISRTEIS